MRAFILAVLLSGCSSAAEIRSASAPPAPPKSAAVRDCPPLPTLPKGAGRKAMLAHIDKTAGLYAQCATGAR